MIISLGQYALDGFFDELLGVQEDDDDRYQRLVSHLNSALLPKVAEDGFYFSHSSNTQISGWDGMILTLRNRSFRVLIKLSSVYQENPSDCRPCIGMKSTTSHRFENNAKPSTTWSKCSFLLNTTSATNDKAKTISHRKRSAAAMDEWLDKPRDGVGSVKSIIKGRIGKFLSRASK